MQRSTSIRISGSRSVPCQQLFLVWLGIWWWAVGVIYLVRKGWQLCGAFSKFTSASYNFYYINLMPLAGRNIHIYQVVDYPSFFRLWVDFLPPLFISGGLISYYILWSIPLSNSWRSNGKMARRDRRQSSTSIFMWSRFFEFQSRPRPLIACFTSLCCLPSQVILPWQFCWHCGYRRMKGKKKHS